MFDRYPDQEVKPMRLTIRSITIALAAPLLLATTAVSATAHQPQHRAPAPAPAAKYATNGAGNNLGNPAWGAFGADLLRRARAAYGNGISSPAGATRPGARALSNALSAQSDDALNDRQMSDFVYVFGQFLDHDIGLSTTSSSESFPLPVPTGDPSFDPNSTGTKTIGFTRSTFNPATGSQRPRQQTNTVTAFVDGSQIYGSDTARANALRTFSGGRLKTSSGNMMPLNSGGLPNANDAHFVPDSQLFLGGDVRANENVELTSLQTLFMREHNRIAAEISSRKPNLNDEQTFQDARRVVIGELQAITYNEFLPALLGRDRMPRYRGYEPRVNPGIANEFSTAAFRFGHSLLDGEIGRLNDDGSETPQGPIALRNAFFNPTVFNPALPNHEGDIDPFMKSAASGTAQEVDLKLVDDVRNFLFGPPGSSGLDLAALNIQRGRDHGLADYNTMRTAYGLPRVTSFSQISSDPATAAALQSAYGSINDIDLWVGGLAEDHVRGGSLGPLFTRIIADQFTRLRDGDRLFYQRTLRGAELDRVRSTTLAKVIKANTSLINLQANVFFYSGE